MKNRVSLAPSRFGAFASMCVLALCALVSGASCTKNTRLARYERELGTGSKIKFEFHRIPDDPSGLGLRFPGLVLGFEKAPRDAVKCPTLADDGRYGSIDLSKARGADADVVRSKLEGVLKGKCIFLSHLVEYQYSPVLAAIDHRFHYNLYAALQGSGAEPGSPSSAPGQKIESKNGEQLSEAEVESNLKSAYAQSWNALDHFAVTLDAAAKAAHATHIVLYTMGWYSGQTEALRNVNSLHLALKRAHAQAFPEAEFRPFPVVVTWPSHWRAAELLGLSYKNKAQDADELGVVYINALINQQILPYAQQNELPTIAIGHSLGSRAISRGLFSGDMLVEGTAKAKWDLFVGLQGAFSVNRFLDWDDAEEGSPYTFYKDRVRNVVLTWSNADTANPIAFWSRHAGGKKGHKYAAMYEDEVGKRGKPVFRLREIERGKAAAIAFTPDSPLIDYLDASSVVHYENYAKGGGAHNDVYSEDIAQLLANAVHSCAPGKVRAQPAAPKPSERIAPPTQDQPPALPPPNTAGIPLAKQ